MSAREESMLFKYSAVLRSLPYAVRLSVMTPLLSSSNTDADFRVENLELNDDASYRRLAESVEDSLDLLRESGEDSVNKIVILPVTLPNASLAKLTPQYQKALSVMNDTLHEYAEGHIGFAFVD